MPANDWTGESGGKDQLNEDSSSETEDWAKNIKNSTNRESEDIDWEEVRKRDRPWEHRKERDEPRKHWKERVGDTLPPGNYNIDTGETDIDAAQTVVEDIFDDTTEYHIMRTTTSAYRKEIRRGNYSFRVIFRTHEPTPVIELPDYPRIRSGTW